MPRLAIAMLSHEGNSFTARLLGRVQRATGVGAACRLGVPTDLPMLNGAACRSGTYAMRGSWAASSARPGRPGRWRAR